MVIDYELAWAELKGYLISKNSHGQRDLLQQITQIEVQCRVPEGEEGIDPTPRRLAAVQPADRRSALGARHG